MRLSPVEDRVLRVAYELEERGEEPSVARIVELTGLTLGQVEHAVNVLQTQGLAEA